MAVREFKTREVLDLSSYDIEAAELLSLEWRKEINEIELKLRCPVAGWQYKEMRIKFLRSLGLGVLISNPCVQYLVILTFLGVTEVTETLMSQGYAVVGSAPSDTTWMQSFIFRVDDIRIVKARDAFRFYLRTEELQLDFNFVDCILRDKCEESK